MSAFMRLFYLTSHINALTIVAEGFPGAQSAEPVCYLLLDSLEALRPLDPAMAVLEIEGDLPLQELATGIFGASPPARYRLYVAAATDLARARIRLIDPRAGGEQGERRA
jgi:hypothetical protein